MTARTSLGMRVLTAEDREQAFAAAEAERLANAPAPTGRAAIWSGRRQIMDAFPLSGDLGSCSDTDCGRELCYCARCVYPESMRQAVMAAFCHECLAEILDWGPHRRLHRCATCTCVEGE